MGNSDRELQRLGDYHERLDEGLAKIRASTKRIEQTLYGEPDARPEPIHGLVRKFDDWVRSMKRLKWAALFVLTVLTTVGAFLADIGKSLITEGMSKKIFHSAAADFKDQNGKQRIKKTHIVYTPNPKPTRTDITETKDKIVEETYIYRKPQD